MNPSMPAAPILVLGFLITIYIATAICNEINHIGHVVGCTDSEKQALLGFKQGLEDPSNRLSSWNIKEDNCCKWAGVVCNNVTGHVIELHLQNPYYYSDVHVDLRGEINPSLLNLRHLSYLNLSDNDFGSAPIPSFIGSLASLQYLDLSNSRFKGTIPPQLGNLTSLRFLSLHGLYQMKVENLDWLPGLSYLEHLDLSDVNLNMAPIPSFVGSLASLQYLDLSNSHFEGTIPPQLGNLTSLRFLSLGDWPYELDVDSLDWLPGLSHLEHLDLSGVNLTMAPNWVEVINKLPFLVELHLSHCELDGSYNNIHGVDNFTSLAVLDLSGSDFYGFRIPNWIFSLSSLVSLDLSQCGFLGWPQGSIEHEFEGPSLQNMTRLRDLDISNNEIEGRLPRSLGGNLCNLTFMDLSSNKFHGELFMMGSSKCPIYALESLFLYENRLSGRIPDKLEQFKNLQFLDLRNNSLSGPIPMDLGKLTSLKSLNLNGNQLNGTFPESIGKLTSLEFLDLSGNQLNGTLPESIGKLTSLEFLDLSGNQLNGTLPESIGKLTSLEGLYLNGNQLNGTLPESLGNLSKLRRLDISDNLLEGIVISEVHFANLTNLIYLHASRNWFLKLKVSPNWVPPFQLEEVRLASWHLGPEFPTWIQSQKQLMSVDLSSCGIVEEIPTWLWNLTSSVQYLNLSHNQIHGGIPYIPDGLEVYLGFNQLNGSLPRISPNLFALDLSNNSFSGSILHFLCDRKDEQKELFYLNLENNLLSGEIPDCWMNFQELQIIAMGNNHLTGNIPSSIFRIPNLQSLHLRNNHLSGEISSSLQNCTNLTMVDLSENELTGNIPIWIGEIFSNLRVLCLRSNKLDGPIPPQLCGLSSLQVLDLAHNNLSGPIPWCIDKFTSMMEPGGMPDYYYYQRENMYLRCRGCRSIFSNFLEHAYLMTKGNMYKYDKILHLVASMDFSNNSISGEIPEELTSLMGLISLNLSRNNLIGVIPKNLGNMKSLGSLDLSINQLEGEIPPSIAGLSSLGYLNFSYNNLSGKIPQGPQLQGFNTSSFIGNKLCGRPLANDCGVDGGNPNEGNKGYNEGARFDIDWFYLLVAFGFAVGFWGTSGPILFIKPWRYAYFRFLDDVWTRVCVYVTVNVLRL